MKLRSLLYTSARLLGDASAVKQGKVGRRVKNRVAGRGLAGLLSRIGFWR